MSAISCGQIILPMPFMVVSMNQFKNAIDYLFAAQTSHVFSLLFFRHDNTFLFKHKFNA